ncbi:MAG: chemotaxis protein CheD [Deltaproteobacteria bacterium]|nr:chemotaxis protein CheD [Deltaproteobacteria bacterium]
MAMTHVVGISDCKVSDDPTDTVVTYALGSCVGLSLYDRKSHMGGILHVMLPDSQFRSASREFNPHMYADTGLNALLGALLAKGARREALEARVAGGANMLQHSQFLDIGKRNAEAIVGALRLQRIPILGSSLGGVVGRSMSLKLHDGTVTVRLLGRGEEIL